MNIKASRREFIGGSAAFFASLVVGAAKADEIAPLKLKLKQVKLNIGLPKPFTFLHFSDTHLTEATAEELAALGAETQAFHKKRVGLLPRNARAFAATLRMIKDRGIFAVNTGDLLDYLSEGGFAAASSQAGMNILTTPGNHEVTVLDPNKKLVKRELFDASAARFAKAASCVVPVEVRDVEGIRFVTLDNAGLSRFHLKEALDSLKKAFETEKPVILCCHMPLFDHQLLAFERKTNAKKPAAAWMMIGEEVEGVQPKPMNKAIIDYLKTRKNLKAVLAGHLHGFWQGTFNDTVPMIVAPANLAGMVSEITIS